MTLSAALTFDATTGRPVLTVTSDPRTLSVAVTNGATGVTATATGIWPLLVKDGSGHVWARRSDDGATAVFDY